GGALDSNGGLTGGQPATAVITHSTFVHNLATGGLNARPDGGAISNTAGTSMTLWGCTISDNRAVGGGGGDGVTTGDSEGVGGGISNGPKAVMTMTNCVVADNRAIGGAGGPGVNTHLGAGQQAGFAIGGGIDVSNNASRATITDSLIGGNQAIGGAGGSGNN